MLFLMDQAITLTKFDCPLTELEVGTLHHNMSIHLVTVACLLHHDILVVERHGVLSTLPEVLFRWCLRMI